MKILGVYDFKIKRIIRRNSRYMFYWFLVGFDTGMVLILILDK